MNELHQLKYTQAGYFIGNSHKVQIFVRCSKLWLLARTIAAMVGQRRKAVHRADSVDGPAKVALGLSHGGPAYAEDVFDPFTNRLNLTNSDIVKVCASSAIDVVISRFTLLRHY